MEICKCKVGEYTFYSVDLPEPDILQRIIPYLAKPTEVPKNVLGGRAPISRIEIKALGRLVIKYFWRGGFLRNIVRDLYLNTGRSRAHQEYISLLNARKMGINTPEPVMFINRSYLACYKTWLVTREIVNGETLAKFSVDNASDPSRWSKYIGEVADQVKRLIKVGIFHVDLHPGNVMINGSGSVYIMDFDKARSFSGNEKVLRDAYLCRWRRACLKHNLPDELSEQFSLYLRMSS